MPSPLLEKRLRNALRTGRVTDVRLALEQGASPEMGVRLTEAERQASGTDTVSALGAALFREQWNIAELLVGYGATPRFRPSSSAPAAGVAFAPAPVSAWEAIAVNGHAEQDPAFEWLARRYPKDLHPFDAPGAQRSVWMMLAQRATPERLLQVMDAYDPQTQGPIGPQLQDFIVQVALGKGGLEGQGWLEVLRRVNALDPAVVLKDRVLDWAHRALGPPPNPEAAGWIMTDLARPLWEQAAPDDDLLLWKLAGKMAARGWAPWFQPMWATASAPLAFHVLVAAAHGPSAAFAVVLHGHSGALARARTDPAPLLDALLEPTFRWDEVPVSLRHLTAAGVSFQATQMEGKTPLAVFGACLDAARVAKRPIAHRIAESVAVGLVRAGAPLGADEAAALRPHLPEWLARHEVRALKETMAKVPSRPPRRSRF